MEEYEYARQKRLARARENQRKRNQRPEVRERNAAYAKEYANRPGVKERLQEYHREYRRRPEVRERQREYQHEYSKRPEVKERRNAQSRAKTLAKMAEKLRAAGYTVIKEET
jgi:hypothetical protein